MRDTGMIRVLLEFSFEDAGAAHRSLEGLVGRRLRRDQVDRREDLSLVIVRILLRQCVERVGERAQPRAVWALGEFVVIGGDRLDIAALALGLGADGAALRD